MLIVITIMGALDGKMNINNEGVEPTLSDNEMNNILRVLKSQQSTVETDTFQEVFR